MIYHEESYREQMLARIVEEQREEMKGLKKLICAYQSEASINKQRYDKISKIASSYSKDLVDIKSKVLYFNHLPWYKKMFYKFDV